MSASPDAAETTAASGPRKKTREERLAAAFRGLQVHVIGLSIHHAEVEVREKLAIPEAQWNAASQELLAHGDIDEAAVLSTCNRFEVYFAAPDDRAAMASVTAYLSKRSGLPKSVLRRNFFMLSGEDAVWHIMRVSGGLDSLVVGEGQILSQVRQCYLHSIDVEDGGCGGKVLGRLLGNAVAAGKRVRSETNISKGSVSISSAAVELSELMSPKNLNLPFSEARLAVIGAGNMTRLLVTHLASKNLEKISIVNRSLQRPQELQEQFPDVEMRIGLMDEMWDIIRDADIVFTATSSADYVIDAKGLEDHGFATRTNNNGRPLMLVDIAVPRNVGEDCNDFSNVVAYNVDDLKAVVAKNTALRQREMIEAETLLKEEAQTYIQWRESLSAVPTINRLREKADSVRETELQKCTRKLTANNNLSERELAAVENLSRGIVNKLLHGPLSHLKRSTSAENSDRNNGGNRRSAVKEMRDIFQLNEDDEGKNNRRKRGRRNGRNGRNGRG